MLGLGIALLLAGVVLVVAEAHVTSGGALGALGTAAVVGGAILAVDGAGGGLVLAIVLAVVLGALLGGALLAAGVKVARSTPRRPRSGREALVGQSGRARSAIAPEGQVLVEGALWRARRCFDDEELEPGDPVVVERVDGLTLTVRKAEPWEVV
jgi:membrane-bound serine protease (ClpP class)